MKLFAIVNIYINHSKYIFYIYIQNCNFILSFIYFLFLFRMKSESENHNHWAVSTIEDFLQYVCPEDCDKRHYKVKEDFVKHALSEHPMSAQHLGQLIIKEELFEGIDNDDNDYVPDNDDDYSNDDDDEENEEDASMTYLTPETEISETVNDQELFKSAISHIEHEGKSRYSCNLCGDLFTVKQSCKQHIITVHQKRKDYVCPHCQKAVSSSRSLKDHIRAVHEGLKFDCDLCDTNYSYVYQLKQHKLKVHGISLEEQKKDTYGNNGITEDNEDKQQPNNNSENDIEIEIPKMDEDQKAEDNELFRTSISQVVHEGEKKWCCNLCGDFFTVKQSVKQHIVCVHQGRKDFVCPFAKCNKPLSCLKSLKMHVATVHQGLKKFKCDQGSCDKTYAYRGELRSHKMKIHGISFEEQKEQRKRELHSRAKIKQETDEMSKYLYPEIKIKNEFKEDEEEHESKMLSSFQKTDEQSAADEKLFQEKIKEIVHEGKKKFNCEICSTVFTIKQSAKQHILTVHEGRKDYVCPHCNKALTSKPSLRNHIAGVHEGRKINCGLCDKTYAYQGELIDHRRKVHGVLPRTYDKASDNNHFEKDNTSGEDSKTFGLYRVPNNRTQVYECAYCVGIHSKKLFPDLESLQEHHESEHAGQPIVHKVHNPQNDIISNCEFCGKTFQSRKGLSKHIKHVHENPGAHIVCDLCKFTKYNASILYKYNYVLISRKKKIYFSYLFRW